MTVGGGGGVGLMMREIIPYHRRDVILQPWPIGLGTLDVLVKGFFLCESRQLPIAKGPKKNLINLFSSPPKQHRLGGKGRGGASIYTVADTGFLTF